MSFLMSDAAMLSATRAFSTLDLATAGEVGEAGGDLRGGRTSPSEKDGGLLIGANALPASSLCGSDDLRAS